MGDGTIPVGVSVRHVHVQIRVDDKFVLQMHLDTDDANAAGIGCGAKARIYRR